MLLGVTASVLVTTHIRATMVQHGMIGLMYITQWNKLTVTLCNNTIHQKFWAS